MVVHVGDLGQGELLLGSGWGHADIISGSDLAAGGDPVGSGGWEQDSSKSPVTLMARLAKIRPAGGGPIPESGDDQQYSPILSKLDWILPRAL